jgi:hypothetical protein
MDSAEITVKNGEYPPNFQRIMDYLPLGDKDIIFSYYPYIYNPQGKPISADLMMHEQIHLAEQKITGTEKWWMKYLESDSFRFDAELRAFSAQYALGLKLYRRQVSDKMLDDFSANLSNGIYGKHKSFGEVNSKIRRKAREYNESVVK